MRILAGLSGFCRTGAILLPMIWTIMEGPRVTTLLILAGFAACCEVGRLGRVDDLKRCVLPVIGTIIWSALNQLSGRDISEELISSQFMLALCIYGLPAGICLNEWSRRSGDSPVVGGVIVIYLALALIAVKLVRSEGVSIQVVQEGSVTSRSTGDENRMTFFGIFSLSNIIIGIVPYTVFGLCSPVLALTRLKWYWLPFIALSFAGAAYATLQLATRTGVVAGGGALLVTFFALLIKGAGRMQGYLKWLMLGLTAAAVFGLAVASQSVPEIQLLLDRLRSSGEDTRLGLWLEALGCIADSPLGGGYSHLTSAPWAHNVFLDFTLWNGLPGLIAMLFLYGVALRNLVLIYSRKVQLDRPLVVAICNSFLATFLVGMINPPFSSFLIYCFIFAGFSTSVLGLRGRVRNAAAHSQSAVPAEAFLGGVRDAQRA